MALLTDLTILPTFDLEKINLIIGENKLEKKSMNKLNIYYFFLQISIENSLNISRSQGSAGDT